MLTAAGIFFVVGIIAMVMGVVGLADLSLETGRTLFLIFMALAVSAFVFGVIRERRPNMSSRP